MRKYFWAATLALVAGLLLAPRGASAAQGPVAIGPVEYGGDIPDYFQREIEQTLADAIAKTQGVVVELRVKSCSELECLRGPAAKADVAVLILARVSEEDRSYRIELAAHAVDDGRLLASVDLECNVCGQQELLDAIPAKVVELDAKLGGVQERVEYELTPLRRPGEARGLAIGGWTLAAAGLGGVVAGGVLLALDGRPHAPTCSPGVTDSNGACPNVYTTATAGYVSVGLGVAAVAVGVGLLIHERHRRAQQTRVQATASGLRVCF